MKVILGDALTPDVESAWLNGYWLLANLLIEKESVIYKNSNWKGFEDFVITNKVNETNDIVSLYLKPSNNDNLSLDFKPGQFVSVRVFVEQLNLYQIRQFSLSDPPTNKHFRISVKKEPGNVSNVIHDKINVGDVVGISSPCGSFILDEKASPIVLISAGVGVTPVLSMLNNLLSINQNSFVSWIQMNRSQSTHPFLNEISKIDSNRLHTTFFYSNPQSNSNKNTDVSYIEGRIDLSKVDSNKLHTDNSLTQYYICGPNGFMNNVTEQLKYFGVNENNIHSESFGV